MERVGPKVVLANLGQCRGLRDGARVGRSHFGAERRWVAGGTVGRQSESGRQGLGPSTCAGPKAIEETH